MNLWKVKNNGFMIKKILIITICILSGISAFGARDKVLEEHVNNELTFYKNIKNCTPTESRETNFNSARKIYGAEDNFCHFVYRNNIECKIPMDVAQKFSEVGLRVYNDYSDYGMITSTTADIKYLDNEILYNTKYCHIKKSL